jgi:hypothetical protein
MHHVSESERNGGFGARKGESRCFVGVCVWRGQMCNHMCGTISEILFEIGVGIRGGETSEHEYKIVFVDPYSHVTKIPRHIAMDTILKV